MMAECLSGVMIAVILVRYALVLCPVIRLYTPKCVVFAPKPAIAVQVNVRSTTVTTANAVLNLVVAALRVVVKWHQQHSLKKLQVGC